MRFFDIEVRQAAEGIKVELTASPSIWQEIAEHGGDWGLLTDDTYLMLRLPDGEEVDDVVVVKFRAGVEDYLPAPDEEDE